MAQFDVHHWSGEAALLVNCQSDLLSGLATRFVVPLVPEDELTARMPNLNPSFVVSGQTLVLMPQFAFSHVAALLGRPLASLRQHDLVIQRAIDVLLSGV